MADEQLNGKSFLVIEDDTFLHTLLVGKLKSLQAKGVNVLTALNAEAALKIIDEHSPDLILIAIVLPGLNGLDFLKKIRENEKTKHIPVIILSNLSDTKDKEEALALGVAAYHIKADLSLESVFDDVVHYLQAPGTTA